MNSNGQPACSTLRRLSNGVGRRLEHLDGQIRYVLQCIDQPERPSSPEMQHETSRQPNFPESRVALEQPPVGRDQARVAIEVDSCGSWPSWCSIPSAVVQRTRPLEHPAPFEYPGTKTSIQPLRNRQKGRVPEIRECCAPSQNVYGGL